MAVRRGSSAWLKTLLDYFDGYKEEFEPFWATVDELYRPSQFEKNQDVTYDRVVQQVKPGYVYSFVHGIESMILANNPKLFVQGYPARFEENFVPHIQDVLNRDWTLHGRMGGEVRLCVRDAIKKGVSAVETTIVSSGERKDEIDSKEDDELIRAIGAQLRSEDAAIEARKSQPPVERTFEHDSRVMVDQIVTKFIPIEHFVCDPDANNNYDWKWAGTGFWADLDRMKKDDRLRNVGKLEATHMPEGAMSGGDSPINLVYMHRMYYAQDDHWRMCLYNREHEVIVLKEEDPFWIGCPMRTLSWNTDGRSLYGQSDVLPVVSQISQLHTLYSKTTDAFARQSQKTTFYDQAAGIPDATLNAIMDPSGNKWVPINRSSGQPLAASFYEPMHGNISPEAMNLIMLLERSIQQSAGMSPSQMGQIMKSDTSAQEAAQLKAGSDARALHKFEAVEEFIGAVAQQRLGLMAQFYDATKVARIGGPKAAEAWEHLDWTREDVQHGLNIKVEPGSTRSVNDDTRTEQLLNVLRLVGQDPGAAMLIDREELYRRLFKHMGFHDSGNLVRNKEEVAMIMQRAAQMQANQPQPQQGAPSRPPQPQGAQR